MLPQETIFSFFIASTLLALAPGPDNIFVLTQSALHGKLSGIIVMLGLCTGILFHTAAVAFGVAVIFQASAVAFTVLKLVGACYLLYLAWQVFRAAPEQIQMQDSPKKSLGVLYRRGIIMNITNPKVSIFFLAFLPQFVDPQRGAVSLQMISLGAVFIISTTFIFGAIALIGGTLGEWLNRSAKAQRAINWIAGTVFVGLALKLVTAER